MAQTLVRFRESCFSPWGTRPRSTNGRRSPLPDASKKYSSCVGSISSVNHILGERGLQHPTHTQLPPLVDVGDCSGLSPSSSSEELFDMANGHRKGKKVVKKKQAHFTKEVEKEVPTPSSELLPPTNEESKLVELASFPGYNPHHPTPLPHGLEPLEQMRRTSRAQILLCLKREGFRETWRKLFYRAASLAIFQDYFWWFFLHNYQNSKLVLIQDQLFNRISANYVSLLCENVDLRWRDPFFKVYPDVIAQCVYSTFIHAYPASWNSFDDKFKTDLMKFISLWQVGTRPIANAWKKWELSILEPTNLLKHIGKEQSEEVSPSSAKSPRKRTPFELDSLLREQEEKEQQSIVENIQDQDDVTLLSSKDSEAVRISLSNFDKELTSSLASEQIYISASKEKLVRTQAQATREQLTKNVRDKSTQPKAVPAGKVKPQINKTTVSRKDIPSPQKVNTAKSHPSGLQPKQTRAVTGQQKPGVLTQRGTSPTKKVSTATQKIVPVTKAGKVATSAPARAVTDTTKFNARAHAKSATTPTKQFANSATPKLPDRANTGKLKNPSPPSTNKNSQQALKKSEREGSTNKTEDKKYGTVWKERAVAIMQQKKESDESVPMEGPKFDHVRFDIYGQSPLVKHYLRERALSRKNETKVLVGRTELVEEPPPDAVCYKQVLVEAQKNEKRNHVQFEKHYRQQKKSMAQSHATRREASQKHDQDKKKLLSNKGELRHLSNEIATYVLSKGDSDNCKEAISSAIKHSLNRIGNKA